VAVPVSTLEAVETALHLLRWAIAGTSVVIFLGVIALMFGSALLEMLKGDGR
jgi:hypothetical protein